MIAFKWGILSRTKVVVDIFEERYKRNISWEVQVEAIKIIGKQHLVKALPLLEQIVKKIWSMIW